MAASQTEYHSTVSSKASPHYPQLNVLVLHPLMSISRASAAFHGMHLTLVFAVFAGGLGRRLLLENERPYREVDSQ